MILNSPQGWLKPGSPSRDLFIAILGAMVGGFLLNAFVTLEVSIYPVLSKAYFEVGPWVWCERAMLLLSATIFSRFVVAARQIFTAVPPDPPLIGIEVGADRGRERQILQWFRDLGPRGVDSRLIDLSEVSRRIQRELNLDPNVTIQVLIHLRAKGLISTGEATGSAGVYRTTISDVGARYLEAVEIALRRSTHVRRPMIRGRFWHSYLDATGLLLLGSFTNVGSVGVRSFRADLPFVGRWARSEIAIGAQLDVKGSLSLPAIDDSQPPLVAVVEYTDGHSIYRQLAAVDNLPIPGSNLSDYNVGEFGDPIAIDDFTIPY